MDDYLFPTYVRADDVITAAGGQTVRARLIIRFAKKLTLTPFEVKEADVSELRRQGWDNAAILETALVVSHFNFLNRMATALGVVPEAI